MRQGKTIRLLRPSSRLRFEPSMVRCLSLVALPSRGDACGLSGGARRHLVLLEGILGVGGGELVGSILDEGVTLRGGRVVLVVDLCGLVVLVLEGDLVLKGDGGIGLDDGGPSDLGGVGGGALAAVFVLLALVVAEDGALVLLHGVLVFLDVETDRDGLVHLGLLLLELVRLQAGALGLLVHLLEDLAADGPLVQEVEGGGDVVVAVGFDALLGVLAFEAVVLDHGVEERGVDGHLLLAREQARRLPLLYLSVPWVHSYVLDLESLFWVRLEDALDHSPAVVAQELWQRVVCAQDLLVEVGGLGVLVGEEPTHHRIQHYP